MRTLLKQRGFFLNPFRFEGTVQSGAFSTDDGGTVSLEGASLAAATVSAEAEGALIVASDQAAAGAFSAVGEGAATLSGASIAASSVMADGIGGLTVNAAATQLACDAAEFDEGVDHLQRTSAMSGQVASKQGIISVWIKNDDTTNHFPEIFGAADAGLDTIMAFGWNSTDSRFDFNITDNTGLNVLVFTSGSTYASTAIWYHLLIAWNTPSTVQFYVNDVADSVSVTQHNNANTPWNLFTTYTVGAFARPITPSSSIGLAELYVAPGQYIDISVEENRRKFISDDGKPVSLGATGSVPTGTAPLIYLHLDDGEAANNLAVNRTGKGNFTVSGALSTYPSSPSD